MDVCVLFVRECLKMKPVLRDAEGCFEKNGEK